jgi:hypothetical protein
VEQCTSNEGKCLVIMWCQLQQMYQFKMNLQCERRDLLKQSPTRYAVFLVELRINNNNNSVYKSIIR